MYAGTEVDRALCVMTAILCLHNNRYAASPSPHLHTNPHIITSIAIETAGSWNQQVIDINYNTAFKNYFVVG